ncbi:unnamed protein product [Lathyrus oleraceus]|nr:RNA polymerase I termination factor-like isoform X1 [Pisum sativum]XP_050871823.1 RNA polymerase I termination factor-like isoform X1 [Pisum sativum]KAI5418284.1 hypothetical protein KIW84_042786 [Pisum sativum]
MNTLSQQNKRMEDGEDETNRGDSTMLESDVIDLPLAKSNDDQHLVKNNISEDGEQGKKKKKKKLSEERKHNEYNQFKRDEFEDGDDGTEMKKKRMLIEDGEQCKKLKKKKKKLSEESKQNDSKEVESNECEDDDQGKKMKKKNLIEGNTLNVRNDFSSNEGEDGEQVKKLKKKQKNRSEESKQKDYKEDKSNESDDKGKKMKKQQKVIEGNTLNERNDFSSNGGEDGEQAKKLKKKKKKLSEESEQKDYKEDKSNESEHDDQGKKMKKQQKLIEGNTLNERNDFSSNEGEDGEQAKKLKKQKKKLSEESEHEDYNKVKSNEREDDDHEKKVKKKKKLIEGGRLEECNDVISNGDGDQGKTTKKKNKPSHKRKSKKDNDFNSNQGEVNDQGKTMKKKREAKAVTNDESPNSAHNGTSKRKRVTFSNQVETFCCDGLVRGKRFTPEEDEKIKAAVYDYIDSHCLGDEGVDMILHSQSYPSIRGCWKAIAQALPHRPLDSVSKRGHVLFENNVEFEWTPDEREFVRKAYEQHGPDWRAIADALGKSRNQVKDLWRRLKCTGRKTGPWSQEEYQTLFNLVNLDLRTRALEPYRKSQHGMLRDNICWEAISQKLKTRDSAICCMKWYGQLISPMTATGEWLDSDDFRLIDALYALDACSMEEVDWDNLIEYRSGDVCRQRWDHMVQHIGDRAGKSFIEQVEILAKRFCPDLLEARVAFDNKPVVC